ncbi:hypothetical protein ACFOHQ_18480 [Xanthomonas fragariae]
MSILRFLMVAFIFLLGGCRDGFSQSRTVCVTGYNEYEKKSMSFGWIMNPAQAVLEIHQDEKVVIRGEAVEHSPAAVILRLERLLICSGVLLFPRRTFMRGRELRNIF